MRRFRSNEGRGARRENILSMCGLGDSQANQVIFSSNDVLYPQALFLELLRHSVHTYKGVRDTAVNGVSHVTKRYPCLSGPSLPFALAALSGLPLPSPETLMTSLQGMLLQKYCDELHQHCVVLHACSWADCAWPMCS